MNILYSNDQCGAGKTFWLLREIAGTVGRYVVVVDRQAVIEERLKQLAPLLDDYDTHPHVAVVTSEDSPTGVGSVGRRIQEAGAELSGNHHAIVFITHAGMKLVKDWSGYDLWDAIFIDEVPSILERGDHKPSQFYLPSLEKFYGLTPTDKPNVSTVTFKGGLSRDDIPPVWDAFHQRVIAGDCRVDLAAWSDFDDPALVEWSSWRIWDVTKLSFFNKVRILGDSFDESDTAHLIRLNKSVTFEQFKVASDREWKHREVVIRYVSETRHASKSLFTDGEFAPGMDLIAAWLNQADTPHHLWASNNNLEAFAEGHGVTGLKVTPKQAGTNLYMGWHKASMIYAAKPSPAERRFFTALGISPDVIVASRETSDIYQFFMRTSLRVPDSTHPVEFRLFDKHQAETFAAKLLTGYGIEAELVHDEIDLIVPTKKMGRPAKNGVRAMTQDERREADKARKAAGRLAKKQPQPQVQP